MSGGGHYEKCDCCQKLFRGEELETITVKIKKCKTCNPNIDTIVQTRPELKSLGGPMPKMVRPAGIAEVSMTPPGDEEKFEPFKKDRTS